MIELIYIIIAGLIISLVALIGIITLAVKEKVLNEILLLLVGFSAEPNRRNHRLFYI